MNGSTALTPVGRAECRLQGVLSPSMNLAKDTDGYILSDVVFGAFLCVEGVSTLTIGEK
jgi:hypothetical protein